MAMQGIQMTASAEEPAVAGSSSSVPVVGDVFAGSVVDPAPSSEEDERDHEGAVLGDEEGDLRDDEDYFVNDDDYDYATVDSDSEFEEEDDEVPQKVKNGVPTVAAAPCNCMFLGWPARMATAETTVCFVTLAILPPCPCRQCHHGGGGEIIVDYRYTRFLRAQSGGGGSDGVERHILGPKEARLCFALDSPLASDSDPVTPVSGTLRLAGAVLASLLYPARFSAQLQAMWRATTAAALVPARAARILVTVDVGILRPGDCTPARMRSMCEAVQSVAGEGAAAAALLPGAAFDIAAVLHLPAVLRSEDDVRPTKRRRVTGEDCPICCEVLEKGLAAWPQCSHIFHAGCLEQHLLRGRQECPLCRSELKLTPPPCGQ